jgi:hypothetical protein
MKNHFPRVRSSGFAHPLLPPTLLLIGLAGVAGLGEVWLRQEISQTANRTRQAEQQLAQTERDLAEVGARITAEQSIDALDRRNTEWQLGLGPPREPQVVRVAGPVEERLAARRGVPELYASLDRGAPPSPFFPAPGPR